MTAGDHNLHEVRRLLTAGDLDAITPAQIEQIERALADDAAAVAALGRQTPPLPPSLARALQDWEREQQPAALVWEHMWSAIDAAVLRSRRAPVAVGRRRLRLWQSMVAAAAGLILFVSWQAYPLRAVEPWPLRLAGEVDIEQLEVFQDATTFVVSLDGDGGQIIWVLPAAENL